MGRHLTALLVVAAAVVPAAARPGAKADELPFLGVQIRTDEDVTGATVVEVLKDSPAEKAGLKSGDVIRKVGDVETDDHKAVIEALRKHKAGDTVVFLVRRDKEDKKFKVTLGKRPPPE